MPTTKDSRTTLLTNWMYFAHIVVSICLLVLFVLTDMPITSALLVVCLLWMVGMIVIAFILSPLLNFLFSK